MQMLDKHMDHDCKGMLDFAKHLNDMEMLGETRVLVYLVYRDFICSEPEREAMLRKTLVVELSGKDYQFETLHELMEILN